MNKMFQGQNQVSGGGVASSGNFTFADNPSDGDPMPALNGYADIIFADGGHPEFPSVAIGEDLEETLINLAAALNDVKFSFEELAEATYSSDATHLIVIYSTPGIEGDSYTLGANTGNITRSAATLQGGSD